MTAALVIEATWPGVVLVLGVVGLSLGTVCFTIWTMKRRDEPYYLPAARPLWPGERSASEEDTKVGH